MPRADGSPRVFQSDRILRYIQDKAGQPVYLDELMQQFQAPRGSIQTVMKRLRSKVPDLHVVTAGRVWRWAPDGTPAEAPSRAQVARAAGRRQPAQPQPAARVFEEVGTTRDGGVVIRDEQGAMWRASPL